MRKTFFFKLTLILVFFVSKANYASIDRSHFKKDSIIKIKNTTKQLASPNPPKIIATGDQIYCPGTTIKIATSVTITPGGAETGTDAVYIQISSGYVNGIDQLILSNTSSYPMIVTSWSAIEGKLKLSSPTGIEISYSDFEAAIKDVTYSNAATAPSGTRDFSINLGIGSANYLPRNGHFYEYVENIGISWTAARDAAANSTPYYGLQGYLATLTAADEAKISGEQAIGNGWIGGSDSETEGVWKWMTGPEVGTIFWNGGITGSPPANQFAFWNIGEPNNSNGREHYAHVKAPGVPGTAGSWNDLQLNGDPSGDYQSKGYIVEYGGMPGEPPLQIATSTTLTILQITSTTPNSRCGTGTVMLQAAASSGNVKWYDASVGGILLHTGISYTTPLLNTTTTYYVDAGCATSRTAVIATINTIPTITTTNSPVSRCGIGSVTLEATTSNGIINWYSTQTGDTIIGTGISLIVSNVTQNTTYYTEAINNGCSNGNRVPVEVIIYTIPATVDQELILCKSSTLILDAQIPNMTYLWSNAATTATITVSTSGIYTVDITSLSPENCTSRKKITVVENDLPEIDRVDVNGTTVVIYLTKAEDYYEYSIDGINYQSSNLFVNVLSGLQTAYVRGKNSCGIDSETFIVLIAPKFFTPNNDLQNDLWEIKGLINYLGAEVAIFDRYGKLITKLNATNPSWDGTFNNNLLPASDYWYILKIDDSRPVIKGHFSLKR